MNPSPLVDSLGRIHTNLRISVTDRCNIRCFYCMPEENVQFKPRSEILTFEEIERFGWRQSLASTTSP
jgi:cyclic pyranopterin phosphate synthase